MKILDSIILARTKNRTHRIRNSISVIISSLLFSVLFFGTIFISGVLNSAEKYQDFGFNDHYLTTANRYSDIEDWDKEQKEAEAIANQDLESRGIQVTDEITESTEYVAHIHDLILEKAEKKYEEENAKLTKEIDQNFHPSAKYKMLYVDTLNRNSLAITTDPDPLLTKAKTATENRNLQRTMTESSSYGSFDSPIFSLLDDKLAENMLIDGQEIEVSGDGTIPIFIPYKVASNFSSVEFNEKDLSTADLNEKYRELAEDLTGKTIKYCYRNDVARELLSRALEYNYQLAKDKSKETPIVIENCAPINDKRLGQTLPTDTESKLLFPESKDEQKPKPSITKVLRFRVVGFSPYDDPFNGGLNLLFGVNSWPTGNAPQMIIPFSAAETSSDLKQIIDAEEIDTNVYSEFFDFANRDDQKRFIASGCTGFACEPKDLMVMPFGNLRVALETYIDGLRIVLLVLGTITIFVAMITTMAVIGKTIGESRREIAIFRTLGARRRDIAQIYVCFGLILTFRALILAFVLALVAALIISYQFADSFNAELIAATGAYTSDISISLIGFNPLWLAMISGALILASLIGLILPITLGTRRKLIDQLREE